ncbi:GNAT family N-acetyltransferase [Patescibacteria group bacterium]|nr:GNAT family N-acetyltransferase [Patescibacteria group bacterium]
MKLLITKRKLTAKEIDLLQKEISDSLNITLFSKHRWRKFDILFVATHQGKLVGVCAVVDLDNWGKIGPLIILKNYQGKKCGTKLLNHVVTTFRHHNLFIGSSNSKVWSIVNKLRFNQIGYSKLPKQVKLYFFKYIIENLNCSFILDTIKKRLLHKRGEYKTFIRCSSSTFSNH